MIVYLAGPIDRAGGYDELPTLKAEVREWLQELGVVIFDPSRAWTLVPLTIPPDAAVRLQDINITALEHADLLLALNPPEVPTVGVPIEVMWMLDKTDSRVAVWAGEAPGVVWQWLAVKYSERVKIVLSLDRQIVTEIINWAKGDNV